MKKNFARSLAALALVSASAASHAAIDISAAVTESKADIATAGGLIIGVVVAIAAFSWIRRVVK